MSSKAPSHAACAAGLSAAGAVTVTDLRAALAASDIGDQLHALVRELYPLGRSLTGNGVRESLAILRGRIPLDVHEVPSGTRVFDWEIPDEWNIRDAWITNGAGDRIVDFKRHNLHVVGYSHPVRARVSRTELLRHLHTLPEQPGLIPYRTSYYTSQWGFCVPHRLLSELTESEYDVCIDATLEPGALTYGEYVVNGTTGQEILITAHTCHPSLANDNLSGNAIAALLAEMLRCVSLRYCYRFLFIPGTIGALSWLARNEHRVPVIRAGLVLTCLGDPGPFTYKRSNRGNSEIDRLVAHLLAHGKAPWQVRDFSPYGYDERQFCSPGFDLAVGRLSRSPHGEFPEYHTSADDLSFVTPAALAESFSTVLAVVDALEGNRVYQNLSPKGEPQLGRRGLYGAIGGTSRAAAEMAMLWVLNQSDGRRSLLDIAERAALPFDDVRRAATRLERHGLLRACDGT